MQVLAKTLKGCLPIHKCRNWSEALIMTNVTCCITMPDASSESYFNPAHLDTTLISIIFVLYLQAVYPLKQYDILVLSPANISDLVSDLSYLEIWNRNLLP
jgi:hypothetical protein